MLKTCDSAPNRHPQGRTGYFICSTAITFAFTTANQGLAMIRKKKKIGKDDAAGGVFVPFLRLLQPMSNCLGGNLKFRGVLHSFVEIASVFAATRSWHNQGARQWIMNWVEPGAMAPECWDEGPNLEGGLGHHGNILLVLPI